MSYILKALKQADQERRRDRVPKLSDLPPTESRHPHGKGSRWPLWVGSVLVVCLALGAGAFIWWQQPWRFSHPSLSAGKKLLSRAGRVASEGKPEAGGKAGTMPMRVPKTVETGKKTEPPGASAAGSKAAQANAVAESGRHAPEPKTARRSKKNPSGSGSDRKQAPAPAPVIPAEPEPVAKTAASEPKTAKAVTPAEKARVGRELVAQLAAVAPAPKRNKEVPDYRDLPLSVRRAIPPMRFSMLIYSDKPSERMLSINGTIEREGNTVAPDLVLLEITPQGAIFRYKNHSFYRGVF